MKNWTGDFWDAIDSGTQDAPNVELACISGVEPLAVSLRGLVYKGDRLLVNAFLLPHKRKADVHLADGVLHGDTVHKDMLDAEIDWQDYFNVGDEVAVQQLRGKQRLVVLCKVVGA